MKKFLALFLAIMAMLTVCAVAVYADGEESEALPEYYLFLDGKTKTDIYTQTVTGEGAEATTAYTKAGANLKTLITGATEFKSLKTDIATIDAATGVVTPVKTGDATIRVWDKDGNKLGDYTVHVIKRTVTDIRITAPTKTYYVGDIIPLTDVKVKFDYNNGDEDSTNVATSEYELKFETGVVDAAGRLLSSGDNVKVTVISKNNPAITTTYFEIKVINNVVTKLTLTIAGGGSQFVEGSVLPGFNVTAKFTNNSEATVAASQYTVYIYTDGAWEAVSGSRLLKTADKKIKVYYNGVYSNEVAISVTEQSSGDSGDSGSGSGSGSGDVGDTSDYMGYITGTLSKKTYYVGDKIDWTGVTVTLKNGDTTVKTFSSADLQSLAIIYDNGFGRKFTEADVKDAGQTNVVLEFEYLGNKYKIVVTGLTVKKTLGKITFTGFDGIVFENKAYKVGTVLTLDDINYVVYFYQNSIGNQESKVIMGEELSSYSNAFALQVLTPDKKVKSSNTSKIESSDLFTKDGNSYVNVRFVTDSKYCETTLPVTNPDVEVYYGTTLLDSFGTIDEAIAAVNALSITDYPPITGKVVTIKLTSDEKVSSNVTIKADRRIEINLNGKKLSMDSDAVNPDTGYYVTITNTSSTKSTFTYTDKKIDIILSKNDSITFEKDYDEKLLPGLYAVTLDIGKNGSYTSKPEASKNEIVVGHGSEIEIVLTPKSGFMVEEIALGTSKITSSSAGYTIKDGVVTLKISATSSINGKTLKATFAEDDPLATWENPFTDVKSSADYYDAVAFVNVNGLLQGTDTTKFSPTGTLTRAQFVTILGRLCGIDADLADAIYGKKASKFTDVTKSDSNYGRYEYAVPYIIWATEEGLIEGHGGNRKGEFGPLDPITHQQMYVIMERYADKIEGLSTAAGTQTLTFTDKGSIASWAINAVKFAQKMDFIVETSANKISPETYAKRWELATLLQKFCVNVLGWEG